MSGYGPPTFAQSRGHMGDFPAVRQLVAEAVSPVLRLRGGGVEAEAPSPTPTPPLYPLPLDGPSPICIDRLARPWAVLPGEE